MAGSAAFSGHYKKLNPEQKRAVDTIEGPVMVIAGPGTGKTQILTLRIANILKKTDTEPENILALTFTESGVFSMRRRLAEIVGSPGYRVPIYTFHGFCNDIIKRYPDSFPKIIGASHINDVDKIALLKEIIMDEPLTRLRPFGDNFFYINALRTKISEVKRENIAPKELSKRVKKAQKSLEKIPDLYYETGRYEGKMRGKYVDLFKQQEKNDEFCRIYARYEELLQSRRLYDYDDMVVETIRALEGDQELLLKLQEEYQYILADEHQDANQAQNRLLELLVSFHEHPNLFIVGDEKQAIFRFQGASLENFRHFKRLYPSAETITLAKNYRSRQHVLDAAHSLIQNSKLHQEQVPLKSAHAIRKVPEHIEVRAFSSEETEYLFLVSDIQEKLAQGVSPEEIAILYRNNRDASPIVRTLERTAVPFAIESDQNVLADPDMRKLILLLEAIHAFGDDSRLVPILHIDFLRFDTLDLYKLFAYAKKHHLSLYKIIKSKDLLLDAGIEDRVRFQKLYANLANWKLSGENNTLPEFFTELIEESGFLAYMLLEPQAADKLARVNGFFEEVQSLAEHHRDYRLSNLIAYLGLLTTHNLAIKKPLSPVLRKTVRLMTAHRSKGQEFDYVYIIGATNNRWGNTRDLEHFALPLTSLESTEEEHSLEDERRLFYVALTRAREGVFISYPQYDRQGEPQLPSPFLAEIHTEYKREIDTAQFERSLKPGAGLMQRTKGGNGLNIEDKTFLNELFLQQGLSVTALNNYLESPWTYFYSNLLRVPEAPDKHLAYGSAIHDTLCRYFSILSNFGDGRDIGKEALASLFEDALKRQPISGFAYNEALKKGRAALRGYYDTYILKWNRDVRTEYPLTVLLPLNLPGLSHLRLRGDIDKLEFLGSHGEANVVDYKTGRPQSRNTLLGKTKNATGNYKRQLIFYKLLLSLHEGGKYQMVTGEIDFVEPDAKGKYHKEQFEVSDAEVENLIDEIKRVAEEILNVSFWEQPCDEKKSSYCELQRMLRASVSLGSFKN